MKIPLLDLKAQYQSIRNEIEAAVKKTIEEQDFILGADVKGLEKEVACYCGAKYGVGVASGTDALILALRALNVGPGDEVITTPFTFFATAESISIVGARPVFVDIEPKTYNIDPALIEKKITKLTKAIMPVHLYGQCADMDPIMEIAGKRGLKVIEDNAQSIGAAYKGRRSGSMGDTGALSFFPSKNLGAFGDAGMVVTNDEKLAERVKVLRVHGSSARYIHSEIGMNSRLDNLQAAVLRVKLKHLDSWAKKRQENAARYNAILKSTLAVTPYVPSYNTHVYHQYMIRVDKSKRDALVGHLVKSGVEARVYYPIPLHLQECYKFLGYKKGDMPNSEIASESVLALPVYPELKTDEIARVAELIKNFK
ncbi:MAG: DegT/DnrJ/EryC1/StrS family aminotransferase [Candidatus Omnitrophota bacterium]